MSMKMTMTVTMTMAMTQTSVFSQFNWKIDGNVQTFPRTVIILETPHK